ncbi:putative disease resistance protein RGA3 [Ziziphus jujuba]|uniref:Disease resistance protein RGA3 n=1 Tax=Ziziphus jujuba TaxID=326968 RepID=A0A6P4AVX9_ZIZJJ|nr:putative disease resistance protein RGA3 [Ziziphus jujuba]
MAEAFLKVVLETLNNLIQKEFGLLRGVNKEMEKLSSTLSTICAVLEDAEEKQYKDKAIENWLLKLRDASYELDDILDEFSMEAPQLGFKEKSSKLTKKVQASFMSCFHPMNVIFRYQIANRMKEVFDRLDGIANERMKFHFHEIVEDRHIKVRERRQTGPIITQPQVYGREEDKEKIVNFLVGKAIDFEYVSIYPIVGLGGMGKTTLAQLVFNDNRVNMHFELKIWICVSDDFDVKRLIRAIIESVSGKTCDALEMDPLQRKLQEMLQNKRFLVVLDDVWNEDEEEWDKLKYVMSCGSKGCSIIVTTRLQKVASIMGTIPMHHLSSLSEDDCWLLFKQRAFGNMNEERPNLVKIGKKIVKKCGGVPLAAKALGGLMHFKREENEWLFVMESEIWNLPQDENSILPALKLSYFHLPLELRQCFVFCAIYPKDHKIKKDHLIYLWMANGFISSKGDMEVEQIGNEICNELYWRSFFQDAEEDEFGSIQNFKMHDLVHDLAQSIVKDEYRYVEADGSIDMSRRVRHVTCNYNSKPTCVIPCGLDYVEFLRTFLILRDTKLDFNALKLPSHWNFRSIRAFDSNFFELTSISPLIKKAKHLRYLNLSYTGIRRLPNSILSLKNLQTMDLSFCDALKKLPKHLSRLTNLRHLNIKECRSLSHMPPNIRQLTYLKTLTFFIVSKRRGCHLDELQGLDLGGYLEIRNLEKVGMPMDAKRANLARKRNLKELDLSWTSQGRNGEVESQKDVEKILEALEPPPGLTILKITNYKGGSFPKWLSNTMLENLVHITLLNCKNCLKLPNLKKLPYLKSLGIYDMDFVQFMDNESCDEELVGGFVSLDSLYISALPNLEKLSRDEGIDFFPCLSKIRVEDCPKLSLPCLPSVRQLEVTECNKVLFESISNLHGLTYLDIDGNNDMSFFPGGMLQNLPNLQSLEFMRLANFRALRSLPEWFGNFESLQEFHIERCPRLTCLPMSIQSLTKLQKLYLISCPELEERCKETGEDRQKISHIPEVYKAFLFTNRYREYKFWLQLERLN